MLKGYTTPLTPRGISSLAPRPPWHYVSTSLAIEFNADPEKTSRFLPEDLEPSGDGRCAVYFAEWQFATDDGEEYLDFFGRCYGLGPAQRKRLIGDLLELARLFEQMRGSGDDPHLVRRP